MIVCVNMDVYRYEIHSLVKAFFPKENVTVVVKGDAREEKAKKENAFLFMEVLYVWEMEEMLLLTIRIFDQSEEAAPVCRTCRVRTKTLKSASTKDALKRLLYEILSGYTGQSLPWGDLIGIRPTKLAMAKMEEGKTGEEAAIWLIREHSCSKEKAFLAVDIAQREKRVLSGIHYENGYSLYVGIPFCPSTCLYCSFTSYPASAWKERMGEYVLALEREMRECAPLLKGQTLDTVYIGGGTPTALEAKGLDFVCALIEKYFDISRLQEFTVEAGRPDSITKEKLKALKAHPVTRISVNPQTMEDTTLAVIGRGHTAAQTKAAFYLAREQGFDNINMDIILGLPGEGPEEVLRTTNRIEVLSPDSLTVHSLAIKRGSRLKRIIDEKGYPVFVNTQETMKIAQDGALRMGMAPYYLYRQKNMSGNFENVGYAREGKYGMYNILIMEEKQTILALGAGSVSKRVMKREDGSTRIERCDNPKDLPSYLNGMDEMIDRKRRLFSDAL